MRLLGVLIGLSLLGVSACVDSIPQVRNTNAERAAVVEIVSKGAQINDSIYWPYWEGGGPARLPEGVTLAAGTRHVALARLPGDDWLRIEGAWIGTDSVHFVVGMLEDVPLLLFRGLWLISPDTIQELLLVTERAYWNTWQWDPEGGSLWYGHSEASPVPRQGYSPVSRLVFEAQHIYREHSRLTGEVLAAPTGGAALIRTGNRRIKPLGDVHILETDGTTHHIGRQCDVYYTDSYVPFGTDAAWSPDGRYVILRDGRVDDNGWCIREGTTIYDRNGVVEPDLTDPDDPYRQLWYREPSFGDQVGMDDDCADAPSGVALSEQRNRCAWSPDRQWFATMPGAVDNPHLGELLIYTAEGQLSRRFLVPGWPCNMFQWSPDSRWLAYGGPSGCA